MITYYGTRESTPWREDSSYEIGNIQERVTTPDNESVLKNDKRTRVSQEESEPVEGDVSRVKIRQQSFISAEFHVLNPTRSLTGPVKSPH